MSRLPNWPDDPASPGVLSEVSDSLGMLAGALTTIDLPNWNEE